jgi:predicted adenylyl cyclase CyaB
MRTNIEIKVRCDDLDAVRRRAVALGATVSGQMNQRDTFFPAPDGRLKLRELDGHGELIAYRRPDTATAKASQFLLFRTDRPDDLRRTLELALGTCGIVVKTRQLLLCRHTRIHLDAVDGLGTFVELETVITDQSEAAARSELDDVAAALGLDRMASVSGAYVDLVESSKR